MSEASTAVVCDSTAGLPDDLSDELRISRISLYVILEGNEQRELDVRAEGYGEFFERLQASKTGATTSQPSVGDFVAVYEPLLERGLDIVSVHLSAAISGTCESAIQAREQLADRGGERIHVFDSRSGAGGQGLTAVAAARAAAAGASGAETMAAAERCRENLRMWFALDTLEYLRKGGRIGGAQAWLGSALQIKPILTLEEEITPVERVRTRRRAFERMVDHARELEGSGRTRWVVQYIRDAETAGKLVDEGRRIFGHDPLFVSEVGPVLGAHTGPGMLGIGGVSPAALGE